MSATSLADLERLCGVAVSRESLARLEVYVALLGQWQSRINLIGPSTLDEIWSRHIADSLQLISLVEDPPEAIIDLGAGAGIPGLPLAIGWPSESQVFVHLIESHGKKAAFLREAVRLSGVRGEVHLARVEAVDPEFLRPRPQLVVARALAPLPMLLRLAKPFIDMGATGLFHKGRDVGDELTESTEYWRISHRLHPSRLPGGGAIVEVREIHACR